MTTVIHQFGNLMFRIPWSDYIGYDMETKKLGWKNNAARHKAVMAEVYEYSKMLDRQEQK